MNLQRFTYTTNAQKTVDFIVGFVGWFLGNLVLWGIATGIQFAVLALAGAGTETLPSDSPWLSAVGSISLLCGLLQILANIGALIYFAFTRYWITLGILAAFGASLLLALCAGIVFGVVCFSAMAGLQH